MERAPQTLVLDASTAAKWFLEEEDSDKAVVLRDAFVDGKIGLIAPDLLVYEVANALNYHPKVSVEDMQSHLRSLLDLDIDLIPPSTDFSSRIVETARRLNVSVYDGSYIALSDMTATSLVTDDKRLFEKLRKRKRVFLVSELGRTWNLHQ